MSHASRSLLKPFLIALVFAALIVPRVCAPWRLEITEDEAHHHLKSWHHRYGTNDIYPDFLPRLAEVHGRIPAPVVHFVTWAYHASTLFQRAIIIFIDPQPPLYPTLAEVSEAVSGSSLLALRSISVIGGLAYVWLMFRLGTALFDHRLGLITATLGGISQISIICAGIGRPYALVQAGVAGLLLAFVYYEKQKLSFQVFLLIALCVQSLQWMAWVVAGPLVITVFIQEVRSQSSIGRTLLRGSWYIVLSVCLVGYMIGQLRNPTIANEASVASFDQILADVGGAGFVLFHELMPTTLFQCVTIGLLLMSLVGIGLACVSVKIPRKIVIPIAGSWLASLLTMTFVGSQIRFDLTYTIPMVVFCAILIRFTIRSKIVIDFIVAMLLIGGIADTCFTWSKVYDYQWVFGPFSPMAASIKHNLRPGEKWTTFTYIWANCFYPYEQLPAPAQPSNFNTFTTFLNDNAGKSILVLTTDDRIDDIGQLSRIDILQEFPRNFVLLRVIPFGPGR